MKGKVWKRFVPVRATREHKTVATDLLWEIAELTDMKEATYYEAQFLPKSGNHIYSYETYIKLLSATKELIITGLRERNAPKTIAATARIKVLL